MPYGEVSQVTSEPPPGISPADLVYADHPDWDADTVAMRDGWSLRQWEAYEDARAERDLDEARAEPTSFEGAQVQMFKSEIDGALVVQIDTDEVAPGRRVRVYLNDGDVYDGDPERD